jgi:hypothetical protein
MTKDGLKEKVRWFVRGINFCSNELSGHVAVPERRSDQACKYFKTKLDFNHNATASDKHLFHWDGLDKGIAETDVAPLCLQGTYLTPCCANRSLCWVGIFHYSFLILRGHRRGKFIHLKRFTDGRCPNLQKPYNMSRILLKDNYGPR